MMGAPKSLKKSALTWAERSCSGKSPPVRLTTPVRKAAASCTTLDWARQWKNLAGEAPETAALRRGVHGT